MDESHDVLSEEEEAALLATTAPRTLLRLLQAEPALVGKLFAGFRVSADSLKLSPVRARLRHESKSNPEMQRILREAWTESHAELVAAITQWKSAEIPGELPGLVARWGQDVVRLALRLDPRTEVREIPLPEPLPEPAPQAAKPKDKRKPPASPPPQEVETSPAEVESLREQIRALKEELREARKRETHLRTEMEQAQRSAQRWETTARTALDEASDYRRAVERVTRQLEREQRARSDLEARARDAERGERHATAQLDALRRKVEDARQIRAAHEALCPPAEEWIENARSLIHHGQAQIAANFLSPFLLAHPEADRVREVLAEAHEALGATEMAITGYCTLARKRLRQGNLGEAALFICRALLCSPDHPEARRCLEEVKRAAAGRQGELPHAVLRHLEKAAQRAPRARELLNAVGTSPHGCEPLCITLDTPVEWPQGKRGFTATPRWVLDAIDANRGEAVERARKGLSQLRTHRPEVYASVMARLNEHDPSYSRVLSGKTRPIVVDGSNVAWQATEEGERPRLANLLGVRRELRALGFFPIRIFVDAALVYQIDRRAELETLVSRGEILVADPGTDADEQILDEARALGAAVVTNDRMEDHDPGGRVPKVRFDIEPGGPVVHVRPVRR